MLKIYKNITRKPESKRLVENFFSLSALQGSVYLLNFITFPYLVRILGAEKFGLIVFAQVFIQYFTLITDYGFNLTATREISINRTNRRKVSQIYSSVITIKIGFLLLTFCLLMALILGIDKFRSEWLLYLFGFGMVIGNVLFPIWFFQGMERMKYITFLNLIAKIIFTVSIFLLIKKSSHYHYVLLLNSVGFIVAGILSIKILVSQFGIKYKFPKRSQLTFQLKQGWYIFISTIGINLYKSSDIFLLGLLSNELLVGYYSIAKKIVDFANQFAVIISQTIYPRIAQIIRESLPKTILFLRKTVAIIIFYTISLGIVFFLFPELFVSLVSGKMFPESILSLKILAFVPFIIGLNVPAVQMLLGANLDKEFSGIVTIGATIMIVLNFILIPIFTYKGAAFAFIISEFFVTIGLYVYLKYNYYKVQEISK
jgi:PST family polysaccharide transporter